VLTLPLLTGDISQFRDLAAEFHEHFRAAGI
jgi:hypothetical protein